VVVGILEFPNCFLNFGLLREIFRRPQGADGTEGQLASTAHDFLAPGGRSPFQHGLAELKALNPPVGLPPRFLRLLGYTPTDGQAPNYAEAFDRIFPVADPIEFRRTQSPSFNGDSPEGAAQRSAGDDTRSQVPIPAGHL
jgi:hypothetical protein